MADSLPSTTNSPRARLSESYFTFHERMLKNAFCFKRQTFKGKWASIPRSSPEHKQRMTDLLKAAQDLQSRGK